ncbi:Ribonuclease H domain [Macleaya cordata]|uniref:Ribonuclease H domain n=1 Tax=Macleaya cordata TaxID=56857 RepID=A0A200RCB9_MACCD|nr:Ribonuclease H domain [Macleaya cordata]
MKGFMRNNAYDLRTLTMLGVGSRPVHHPIAMECFWFSPDCNQILLFCDGASGGNPGHAGVGIICRNDRCDVVGAIAAGLGVCSSYVAEMIAILMGLEWAVAKGFSNIIVNSDSHGAVQFFISNRIPWMMEPRWRLIKQRQISIGFRDCFREINFSADSLAKRGSFLIAGQIESFDDRPVFLRNLEFPNIPYYRFM